MIAPFQSAPPVKGAILFVWPSKSYTFVSIRAPREGGDRVAMKRGMIGTVSIRAPREGGDGSL